jgi:hypothetical protein
MTGRRDQCGTLLAHAIADAAGPGGRFARLTPAAVTGATPIPQVPRLPASSPWSSGDPVGPEPPLGLDVNAVEPVGIAPEIEASLGERGRE